MILSIYLFLLPTVGYSKYTTTRLVLANMKKNYTSLTMIAILASVLLASVSLILPIQIVQADSHTKDQKDNAQGNTKTGQKVNQKSGCSDGAYCIQTATNILCTHAICIFGSPTPWKLPTPY